MSRCVRGEAGRVPDVSVDQRSGRVASYVELVERIFWKEQLSTKSRVEKSVSRSCKFCVAVAVVDIALN